MVFTLKLCCMVNLNYQAYGTGGLNLRLRFYSDGETKYVNINRKLKGRLLRKHWNQKKQCFVPSAPESDKNNETLQKIIAPYMEVADSWEGDLKDFIVRFRERKNVFVPRKSTVGRSERRPYSLQALGIIIKSR